MERAAFSGGHIADLVAVARRVLSAKVGGLSSDIPRGRGRRGKSRGSRVTSHPRSADLLQRSLGSSLQDSGRRVAVPPGPLKCCASSGCWQKRAITSLPLTVEDAIPDARDSWGTQIPSLPRMVPHADDDAKPGNRT